MMTLYYMQTIVTGESKLLLIDEVLYNKIANVDQNEYKLYNKELLVKYNNENQPVNIIDPINNCYILCYLKQYECQHGRLFTIDLDKFCQIEK